MPRKGKHTAEIVPASEAALVPQPPGAKLEAMLTRLVRERVDEIIAQPTLDDERQRNMFERRKHALYYEKWGCRRCDTKEVVHNCNGFCTKCQALLQQRERALRKEWAKEHSDSNVNRQIGQLTARVRSAERLLGKARPVRIDEE